MSNRWFIRYSTAPFIPPEILDGMIDQVDFGVSSNSQRGGATFRAQWPNEFNGRCALTLLSDQWDLLRDIPDVIEALSDDTKQRFECQVTQSIPAEEFCALLVRCGFINMSTEKGSYGQRDS